MLEARSLELAGKEFTLKLDYPILIPGTTHDSIMLWGIPGEILEQSARSKSWAQLCMEKN